MAMMTRLVTLEAGDFGSIDNERVAHDTMDVLPPLGEQGQGRQIPNSCELHVTRRQEHAEPAWRGVPL